MPCSWGDTPPMQRLPRWGMERRHASTSALGTASVLLPIMCRALADLLCMWVQALVMLLWDPLQLLTPLTLLTPLLTAAGHRQPLVTPACARCWLTCRSPTCLWSCCASSTLRQVRQQLALLGLQSAFASGL